MASHLPWVILGGVYCSFALAYLFVKYPFRPTQYIVLIAMYSFTVRPIATSLCDTFSPFYMYTAELYSEGALLGIGLLSLYVTGLVFGARRQPQQAEVDFAWLRSLATWSLMGCIFLDLGALALYGTVFLPGERQAGLQMTAPGIQIFFAFVSIFTVIGVSVTTFGATSSQSRFSLARIAVYLVLFFVLSMAFSQRGALLSGIVLGLFMSGLRSRTFYKENIRRTLAALVGITFIAFQGRSIIANVVGFFTGSSAGQGWVDLVGYSGETLPCRIANQSAQEHDQAWPTLLQYVDTFGPDYYVNLVAALARSFLGSGQRDALNLLTSVDQLNIYNNAGVYLSSNFGFSISPFQYHYFSAGLIAVPIALLLGIGSSWTENTMSRCRLDALGFVKFFILYQVLMLLNSAVDEQLRWSILSSLVIVIVAQVVSISRRFNSSANEQKGPR